MRLFRVSVADAFSTDENRPMHSSSRIEGNFQIPVGSSPTRTLHPFWGNFRVAGALMPASFARCQKAARPASGGYWASNDCVYWC